VENFAVASFCIGSELFFDRPNILFLTRCFEKKSLGEMAAKLGKFAGEILKRVICPTQADGKNFSEEKMWQK